MLYIDVRDVQNNTDLPCLNKCLNIRWMLQTDSRMAAFVCDIFCMHVKNVSQHQKYLWTVKKVDLKCNADVLLCWTDDLAFQKPKLENIQPFLTEVPSSKSVSNSNTPEKNAQSVQRVNSQGTTTVCRTELRFSK